MADSGNNHADIMAKRHEEEIQQLFDIANEQEDRIHEIATKLAKLTGEDPPAPLPARESEEDRAAREIASAKAAKMAALKAELAALAGEPLPPQKAEINKVWTPEAELEARRALLVRK